MIDLVPCRVTTVSDATRMREKLVEISLQWQEEFGVAPSITTAVSELDAAMLVGKDPASLRADGLLRTAVTKDVDFIHNGLRYQVTANRPSGKTGSPVTLVGLKTEEKRAFGWDRLIWILYDRHYVLREAREFTAEDYRTKFGHLTRLSPTHMQQGRLIAGPEVISSPLQGGKKSHMGGKQMTIHKTNRWHWQADWTGFVEFPIGGQLVRVPWKKWRGWRAN